MMMNVFYWMEKIGKNVGADGGGFLRATSSRDLRRNNKRKDPSVPFSNERERK